MSSSRGYRLAADELEEEEDGMPTFSLPGVLHSTSPRAGAMTPSSLPSAPPLGGRQSFGASPFRTTSGGTLASLRRLSAPTAASASRSAGISRGVLGLKLTGACGKDVLLSLRMVEQTGGYCFQLIGQSRMCLGACMRGRSGCSNHLSTTKKKKTKYEPSHPVAFHIPAKTYSNMPTVFLEPNLGSTEVLPAYE